jgi:hypothetical protein
VKSRYVANLQAGGRQALRRFSKLTGGILSIVLAACVHHPASVHCDGRLQPINLPAPIQPDSTDATRCGSHLPVGKSAIEGETTGKPQSGGLPGKDPVVLDRESLKP